jgi:hypothetical protein
MHDVPHDSLVKAHDGVVSFAGPFTHPGAVRLRNGWMLLGGGAADLQVQRAAARLEREGAPVLGAFVFGASPIGAGGLGELIFTGIALNELPMMLAGAIPTALLAVVTDFLVGGLQFCIVPRGINPLR